jgi:hypothetical protein
MQSKKKPTKKLKTISSSKTSSKLSSKTRLEAYREKILNTSWHHMQVESGVKQLLVELVDILREG